MSKVIKFQEGLSNPAVTLNGHIDKEESRLRSSIRFFKSALPPIENSIQPIHNIRCFSSILSNSSSIFSKILSFSHAGEMPSRKPQIQFSASSVYFGYFSLIRLKVKSTDLPRIFNFPSSRRNLFQDKLLRQKISILMSAIPSGFAFVVYQTVNSNGARQKLGTEKNKWTANTLSNSDTDPMRIFS